MWNSSEILMPPCIGLARAAQASTAVGDCHVFQARLLMQVVGSLNNIC